MREAVREALRNLRAGVGGSPWLAAVLVVILAAAVILPQLALLDADRRARDFRESGAATLVIQAPGRIDGAQCDSFGNLPNVVAAGAVRELSDGVRLTLLPSTSARFYESTPGFAGVLGADVTGTGVLLSTEVVDALGWRSGQAALIAGGRVPVAGSFSYPDDGRRPGFGFSVVAETLADQGPFDECWVTVWPQTSDVESLTGLVVMAAPGSDDADSGPKLLRVNTSFGTTFDTGPVAYVWEYAAVAGLVLGAIAAVTFVRGRRLELASARHVGVQRADQLAMLLSEMIIVTLIAALVVAPFAVHLAVMAEPTATESLALYALRGLCATLAGVVAGTILAWSGIRERHLFRYFRER